MNSRLKFLAIAVTAVLLPAALVLAFGKPAFWADEAPPFTEAGLPLLSERTIVRTFPGKPELQEVARTFMMMRVDEVLFSATSGQFDPVRAERAHAGLFCMMARAQKMDVPFGGPELARLDMAIRAEFPDEFDKAAEVARGQTIPVFTHEKTACAKVGITA